MNSPSDYLKKAQKEGWAVPHFNFATMDVLRVITEVAANLKSPVFVATSEGERDFFGLHQASAAVRIFRKERQAPIFLNADHTKSWERAQEAIDAGYDAVLVDGSSMPYDQNLALTKKVVEYAKKKNPGVVIEGELGILRGSSTIQESIEVKKEDLTDPAKAKEFAASSGIDLLAPAVGNVHGIVTSSRPKLFLDLIREVKEALGDCGLVLHGASGLAEEDIVGAIRNGISVVHFNTDLRVRYTEGIKEFLAKNPQEVVPYKYLAAGANALPGLIEKKIKILGSAGKI